MVDIPKLTAPVGYRSQAEDTSPESDLLTFHLLRQRTPQERLQMAGSLMRSARSFSLQCFQQRFAHLSVVAFRRKLAEAWLQEDCPETYIPGGNEMTWIQDSIQLAGELKPIFAAVDIPYYITGGVAAIAYGEARTTQDLDVVLLIPPTQVEVLVQALEAAGFYVAGAEDVISGQMRMIQITQIETISRADLVIADDNPYEHLKFERRQTYALPDGTEIDLASPEDIVVNKLRWGEQSQSQKQWRDVLGVLKTQREGLDFEYMHRWTTEFNLAEMFERATIEAGVQAIAAAQWAVAILPVVNAAYRIAQQNSLVRQIAEAVEIVEGDYYVVVRDGTTQTLTVSSRREGQQVAQYDFADTVLMAQPTLVDRQQWREIAQRVEVAQQNEQGDRRGANWER